MLLNKNRRQTFNIGTIKPHSQYQSIITQMQFVIHMNKSCLANVLTL